MELDQDLERRLVFVSHSGQDTWVAKQIAREIEACGATAFLDEAQVDAGADFEEDILRFLERAHELVVLLTPWALERPYVWAELGAAWGRRIPIVTGPQSRSRPEMSKPMRVFISYSHEDGDWARSLAEALQKRGVPVWFDQFEIAAGDSLREAIETGLRESDVFVALVRPGDPRNMPSLFFELGAAIGMKKRVVPIVPKEIDPTQLPNELRLRKYLVRETPEETADQLSRALSAA